MLTVATIDLALEQGDVEKRIQAVQDEVKKQDDAIKELQKKLKVRYSSKHQQTPYMILKKLLEYTR